MRQMLLQNGTSFLLQNATVLQNVTFLLQNMTVITKFVGTVNNGNTKNNEFVNQS